MVKDFFKLFVKYIVYNSKALFLFLLKNTEFDIDKTKPLFITHDLGGGTENYINQNNFSDYVILRKMGFGKDWIYKITQNNSSKFIVKNDLFCEISGFNSYFVNSLVSFSEKKKILMFFINEKTSKNFKLTYAIHDFDCLCENNFNLIRNDSYCELNCTNCRKNNPYYNHIWFDFLNCCDEIRCFSESSKKLILKKYKMLDSNKITVVPHNTDYCQKYKPIVLNNDELHIGFVGNCNNIPKGKKIVVSFLKFAKQKNIKVSVIGKFNLKNKVFSKNIKYLGKYEKSELGEILEREGVNVIFFTSIWPETFSYLISELITLDIPICAFNIGAQGEKIQKYELGYLMKLGNSTEMYMQILDFWRKLI